MTIASRFRKLAGCVAALCCVATAVFALEPAANQPPNSTPPPKAAQPAQGETREAVLRTLYAELAKAPDVASADKIVAAIEQVWAQSSSPTADLLLRRAIAAVQSGRSALALRLLDAVGEIEPDFTETFSRRAYIYFSQQDYARALADLRRVLALDPNHFRAMEGIIQSLKAMGSNKAALEVLRELIKIHPNAAGAKAAIDQLAREVEGQGI